MAMTLISRDREGKMPWGGYSGKNSNTNIQGRTGSGSEEKVAFGPSGGLVLMLPKMPVRDFL